MSAWSPRRRALLVGLLLAIALGLRTGEVERTAYRPINDAVCYLKLASQIAHTGDYSNQVRRGGVGGSRGPTAYFPPGFPYFLAAVDLIDGHTGPAGGAVQPARISQAVVGTAVAGMVGLVGLEAFGELVGLIGIFTPVARRAPWWLWVVPVLLWLSVALINAETPRFREPIDPFLILLGSCALAQGVRVLAPRLVAPARRHRGASVAAHPSQLVEVRERLA